MRNAALALAAALLLGGISAAERHPLPRGVLEQVGLRADIVSLNLVNGLELSEEQLAVVLKAAEEWGQFYQGRLEELARAEEEARPVLEQLREVLARGEEIPEELARKVHEYSAKRERLAAGLERVGRIYAQRVLDVLNENQVALLDEYHPCLIPPKTRDTSAIGSPVGDPTPAARLLDLVRGLPPLVYQQQRERLIEGIVRRVELAKRITITPEQRAQFLAVLDEARRLDDVQYAARREELARKLMVIEDPEAERERNRMWRLQRIRQFLLNPNLPQLLGQRSSGEK